MSMRIYFIRHAESKFNLKEIACNNQKRNRLTKKGKEQAEKLAKKLINIKIDKIFISEAKRAYETILPLIKARKNIPVKKDNRLNECNFGIFGGLSFRAAEKKYPKIYSYAGKNNYSKKFHFTNESNIGRPSIFLQKPGTY